MARRRMDDPDVQILANLSAALQADCAGADAECDRIIQGLRTEINQPRNPAKSVTVE